MQVMAELHAKLWVTSQHVRPAQAVPAVPLLAAMVASLAHPSAAIVQAVTPDLADKAA